MDRDALASLVASRLRDVQDFPEPGVLFKDFTPLLADPHALRAVVDDVVARYEGRIDVIAGIEARGFMIGTACAVALAVPFVPIRKKGKLPAATFTASYDLEYGSATIEVHQDACGPGQRVLIMDDVLATGGTAAAACELVDRTGAQVVAVDIVCEISSLGGRDRLRDRDVQALLQI
ncbi:adenine phosphoribosyltransferase [Piscicoccus intestinalis]|uniref:adenine phosphoribosyltransferase n=1 Tax=Piscicoccus intestinalis TaxID=746033 RepID=UPI000838CBDA|nr:adenine phosphoribosyltransferase [Piscicoccus intestinalis]